MRTSSQVSMESLPEGYRAVVFGATGGIGAAVATELSTDPRCGKLVTLHRRSCPPGGER